MSSVNADAFKKIAWQSYAVDELYSVLQSSPLGLTTSEAHYRQTLVGMNYLPQATTTHPVMRLIRQFHNPLIYLLLIASGVAWLLNHAIDAGVIMAAVLVNTLTGFIQEQRAHHAMSALSELITPRVKVKRDGVWQDLSSRALVPGDVVMLEAGDRVAADAKIIQSHRLRIDESMLTGESLPSHKEAGHQAAHASIHEHHSMVFAGTLVSQGQAQVIVVATGARTELGHVSHLMSSIKPLTTPLIKQIDQFSRLFGGVILVTCALLYAFAVWVRDYSAQDALFALIGLAVAAIPEGLPAVITITLAIGVQRMAKQHAIIRDLPAVETLGATSVICSDKTGTLTQNEMTVQNVYLPGMAIHVSGVGYAPEGDLTLEDDSPLDPAQAHLFLEACVLCNQSDVHNDKNVWVSSGDPMEAALLTLALKSQINIEALRKQFVLVDQVPFDAKARFMATHSKKSDSTTLHRIDIKGAPELILQHCDHVLSNRSERLAFDAHHWQDLIMQCGQRGERVLALAQVDPATCQPLTQWQTTLPMGLGLLGLVSMIDPPRPQAQAAIASCYQAGIQVKMITGDHAVTALSIAKQLGLAKAPHVMTGQDLDQLKPEQWPSAIQTTHVFARTHPEHKLRIVQTLQDQHAIVAMTGDGVNDAPALKQANIGISMGQKSTEAAKQASDMVLTDDNFASIVAAVKEGRTVYDNIQKVIAWTLPTNCGEALIMMSAILWGVTLPISAAQILWVNLITASTLGLALAFESSEPTLLKRPPRPPGKALLSPFLIWRIVLVSVVVLTAIYGTIAFAQHQQMAIAHQNALVVNVLVGLEIAYLFAVRFLHHASLTVRGFFGTPAVWIAVLTVVGLQLLLTYNPWFNRIFNVSPLGLTDWAFVIGQGAVLLILLELEKACRRLMGPRRMSTKPLNHSNSS